MKQSITQSDFIDAFHNCGRGEQFTYDGLKALYDFLEEMNEGSDFEYELDVIALCCEFTEYSDFEELQENYSNIEDREELENSTLVINVGVDSFIIQNF
tara:strand:- start:7256 stop:7552 length:297 start_codon:yes stop_codon:yes gene_type:complete